MNTYTFALAFLDNATHFVGVTAVEIVAKSPPDAALKLGTLRHNPEWLRTVPALDIQDDEDLDGIVAGDFLLMAVKETLAPSDSPENARALQCDARALSDNEKHPEPRG